MNKLKRLHFAIVLVLAIAGSATLIWSQQSAAQAEVDAQWMTAAKQGKADAQYTMGNAYASGMPSLGIKKDPATAFAWYLKAAKQNHVNAQYEVAAAYILGDGVKRNIDTARVWLKRAVAGGHKDAKAVFWRDSRRQNRRRKIFPQRHRRKPGNYGSVLPYQRHLPAKAVTSLPAFGLTRWK